MISERAIEPVCCRDGRELAALRLFRRLDSPAQEAFLRCAERMADGMPLDEAATLAFIELGYSESEAESIVARTLALPRGSWRELLD